jgi:lipoprotein signal peptidase
MVLIYLIPNQVGSYTIPAALMPVLITTFILLLSIILTIQSIDFNMKSKKESQKKLRLPELSLIYVMATMIAYSWLLDYTGFVLTSVVVMFVLFSVYKVRNLKQMSIIIGATLGILYVSFEKLLYAPLPVGTLIEKFLD